MSTTMRTWIIRIAGVVVLLLGVAAALLPLAPDSPARMVIGLLLVGAGTMELLALLARRAHHPSASVAAAASLLAGLRLALDSNANFPAIVNFVVLWLVVRSAALLFYAHHSRPPLAGWVYIAAAVDFSLAVLLLAGIPVAVLVYGLFGQTSELAATLAWILALSFLATGWLLVATAPLEASEAA